MIYQRRFLPYLEYEDSSTQRFEKIPSHWEVQRLKRSAIITMGQSPPSEAVTDIDTGLPFLQGNAEFGDRYPTARFQCDESPKRARQGDFLLSVRAPVGAINVADQTYGIGRGLCSIRPDQRVLSNYLYFQLLVIRHQLDAVATGSTYDAVSGSDVGNLFVALPPRVEQELIADFLYRETSKIDALILKKERLIELLKEKRAALINNAVTKGLDPSVPMKDSGIDWLGATPEHWDVTQLKRHWHVVDCKHLTVPFMDEGIPLASVREVQSFDLDLKTANRTSGDWHRHLVSGGRQPKHGDLIYCRNVSVGTCAYVNTDELFAMGQDVCLMHSDEQNQRYLNYLLHSWFMQQQLGHLLVGSTFNRINIAEIKSLRVLVPPLNEQKTIAAFLDRETAKIDTLTVKVDEANTRLREYRSSLISAAVTGKIDVRGVVA